LIFQVSSTSTKQKIESALSKKIIEDYSSYTFKFISISKEATDLRSKTYDNPYSISFNPLTDIYDITSLLNVILTKEIPEKKKFTSL
jgi:ribosomal protein L4